MGDLRSLAERMKSDWDRRVSHDYRFWMSDGHRDDKDMWQSGERDFAILTGDIKNPQNKTLLEIGCGVGRLLHAAAPRFGRVIGFDVSDVAISKARELLRDYNNVELYAGSGYDLSPIQDSSIDVVISFAALASMPVGVAANYLCEAARILKPDGDLRLQIYLGREQEVYEDDTLHLRCFTHENFRKAAEAAGFTVNTIEELILPIQVSVKEIGLEAVIVKLRRNNSLSVADSSQVAKLLLPSGEKQARRETTISELEYWMALNYARDLVDRGEIEHARETLEYAISQVRDSSVDASELINYIANAVAGERALENEKVSVKERSDYFNRNMAVIKRRFNTLYHTLEQIRADDADLQVGDTPEGRVLVRKGQCLDHQQKPATAAKVWAERLLSDSRFKQADKIAVYGFGSGYHLESLIKLGGKDLLVIEPDPRVLLKALAIRDLTDLLESLSGLALAERVDKDFFEGNVELAIRPQSQVGTAEILQRVKTLFYGERGFSALHPTIGVLGPVMGGTLPIGGYTLRSLLGLNQRARLFEMSAFAGGMNQLEQFVKEDFRKAALRGHYIEMLSQIVIESINEKPIDILICMAQAPVSLRALEYCRQKGIITVLWFVEDYLRFTYWKSVAAYFDFVFTIQRGECLSAIKSAGAGEVHYLPVACDPVVHTPLELSEEEKERWGSPISFVGAGYHNRQQMFASLANLPFKIWGTEWPQCKPFDRLVQEEGRRLKPEEYVKIFNATDININLHSSTERDGVDPYGDFLNPRTFELASCGAFQLCDERAYLSEVLEPGKEIITFKNRHDLQDKIRYYLERPEERREIAERAREKVLAAHTYNHRIHEMLSVIYSSKFEQLKRREKESPWTRMLERSKIDPELHERCKAAFERGEEPNLDGLVSDIVAGEGKLSETEQKLMFLFHVRKQIIRMTEERTGAKGPK
ncbi:MAG: methyltransferase domain-containing protein [Candidatus Dadabacteria bacterium]|nr:MAG: methyltransferase domain-containing protein [Candidatus Dadabacteria bacterium]